MIRDHEKKLFTTWRGAITILVLVALSVIVWRSCFFDYIAKNNYQGDIFRLGIRSSFSPFYIWFDNTNSRHMMLVAYSALYLMAILYCLKHKKTTVNSIALLAVLWIGLSMLAAFTEGDARFLGAVAHIQTFANDLPAFQSTTDILHHYVAKQSQLDIHGQHYPPGFLIMLNSLGIQGTRWLLYIFGGACIVITYLLAKLLKLDNNGAFLAAILLSISPSFLIYSSLDQVSWLLILGMLNIYLILQILESPSKLKIFLLSLSIFALIMFSFMAALLYLLLLIYIALVEKTSQTAFSIFAICMSFLLAALLFIMLYFFTGFNIYDCFIGSIQQNIHLNKSNGFDSMARYALRASANLLGWIGSCGVIFLWTRPRSNYPMSISLCVTIISAALSGLFFGETERVWMILLPAAAIVASQHIISKKADQRVVLLAGLMFCIAIEVYFKHYI